MCPNCRAFIGKNDRTCAYCGERLGSSAVRQNTEGELVGGIIPQTHFTTILILVINVGLFIATQMFVKYLGPGGALAAFGGKFDVMNRHEYWRFVCAGFLHADFFHIAMNSWVLYDLGAQTENVYGTARFLCIYFVTTVGGFYLSNAMSPKVLSIGSSAGIMGLIGAMLAFGVKNRTSAGREIRAFYIRWAIYGLVMGIFLSGRTDNWAHIGGLVSGFILAYIAGTPVRSSRSSDSVWQVLAFACMALTAYSFFAMYQHFPTTNTLR